MKIVVAILVALLVAAGAFIASLNGRYQAAVAELAQLRAATNSLSTQFTELQSQHVDAKDLERLKNDQREAIRLRGELTNLRNQVTNANASASAAMQAAERASASAASARQAQQNRPPEQQFVEPRSFASQASTIMPPGQSLVLGGWPTGTGSVTYAFITPTITEPGTNSVTIEAKYVELPQELATRIATMGGNGSGQLMLSPEQMSGMLQAWQQTPGVNIVSSPRLTTLSGMRGSIMTGQERPTANGPAHFGPLVNVTPTLSADGSQIQLNVDAQLTVPNPTP